MSKVLTTNDLISITRLRGMLPTKDVTFSDDNIVSLLNEELDVFGVNQVLKLNEGYLIYYEDFSIVSTQTKYVIPYRSIGNKLKNLELIDNNGNIIPSRQIDLSQNSDFQTYEDETLVKSNVFYCQNNYIIFPNGFPISSGTIRMYFYLRPNKLVKNNLCGVISAINTSTGVVTLTAFPSLFSSAAKFDFISSQSPNKIYNYDIQPGPTNSVTYTVQFAVAMTVSSVVYTTGVYTASSHGFYTGMTCTLSSTLTVPTGISAGTTYYLIKIDNDTFKLASSLANATAGTAVTITDNGTGTITLTPNIEHLHSELVVGDYLCRAEESLVPQLPTELHPVLAQRVAALCVDALEGTPDNLRKRLKEMETSSTNLISNRVEDVPKKLTQRKGILRF